MRVDPGGRNHVLVGLSLLFAVLLWGGNNTGTKYIVGYWPPLWTGATRFLLAGLLLSTALQLLPGPSERKPIDRSLNFALWLRGGLSLALYIATFNAALSYTAASHVALYLGAAPVWALVWEGRPRADRSTLRRYSAAAIALAGVFVLFGPSVHKTTVPWLGEVLGLGASVLWTNYGRQCKVLGSTLPSAQVSAHTMWRAGLILLPMGLMEAACRGISWR